MSTTYTLTQVAAFLLGEGELDGFHFGDSDTARPRHAHWWRKHLRAALAAKTEDQQSTDLMAECMSMIRSDLIKAGIIDKTVPPMMVSDAVCAHIQRLAKAAPAVQQGGEAARISPNESADYQRGWKDGYKHGAWASQPAAPHLVMDGKSGERDAQASQESLAEKLAIGYEGATCMGHPSGLEGTVRLHYESMPEAENAFFAITELIDAAIAATKGTAKP